MSTSYWRMQTLAFPTHRLLQLQHLITPLPFSTLRPCRLLLHVSGRGLRVPLGQCQESMKKALQKVMWKCSVGLCGILLWLMLLVVLLYLPNLKWMLHGVEVHFFGNFLCLWRSAMTLALICDRTFGPLIIKEPHPTTPGPILMSLINSTCDVRCFHLVLPGCRLQSPVLSESVL